MSSEDDLDLFRDAVGDVKPLEHGKVEHPARKPAPVPRQRLKDEAAVMRELSGADIGHYDAHTGETVSFCRPGVQKSVFKKLKKGHYRVAGELDLHGMRSEEARLALTDFLQRAREADLRCVRVIHGKGLRSSNEGPVLKPLVSGWLLKRDEVLAFCSARPVDGGTGAIYVLLKGR
ncbi:MAG: Smr/MutS family protein [Gammaproteobacteria bacterium]